MMDRRRITIVAPSVEDNSLGRAWVFWMLGQQLGLRVCIIGPGRTVWSVLADQRGFVEDVWPISTAAWPTTALRALEQSDYGVILKPRRESLGVVRSAMGTIRTPLIFDVDDGEIEHVLEHPSRRIRWGLQNPRVALSGRHVMQLRSYRRFLRRQDVRVTSSNPYLGDVYGAAEIIPHARQCAGRKPASLPNGAEEDRPLRVVFVGTVRHHKGLAGVRGAVELARKSVACELLVTDERPPDAAAWEHWVGHTTFAQGMMLLSQADVTVLAQSATSFAQYQLPAKAIDAMFNRTVVIASETPPLAWALGGTGILLREPTVQAIAGEIIGLGQDESRQRSLAAEAEKRAMRCFSLEVVGARLGHLLSSIGALRR